MLGVKATEEPLKVLVTVPNENWLHKELVLFLIELLKDERYDLTFQLPTYRPLANAQHHIIKEFISGYDYWLSIDADVVPLRNPLDLIGLDKDIIGLPTPLWLFKKELKEYPSDQEPIYLGAFDYDLKADAHLIHLEGEGLEKVDAISGACFIIARRVFDNELLRTRGWWRKLNPDGTVLKSNDISFCERAIQEGFEIWTHYGYPTKHFKEVELGKVTKAFERWYQA